ncbi:CHAT domain-containing protein [Myxococcus sp. K15C18031901]|uniref:CHAT domain-containing protein n=1 Tax=Myxococcus dinghuensis TaxID=2906761 RepID=UPI0020A7132F|nr:CHAT domain-containing protein [Myxococcus dinghuensis]MCP3100107.1 CHAT domain-containing protein [Myxococcus dinghuensis]
MSLECNELHRFLADQLSPDEHARFREHLLHCYVCERDFHEAMQLEMLAQMSLSPEFEARAQAQAAADRHQGPSPDAVPDAPVPLRAWRRVLSGLKTLAAVLALMLLLPAVDQWDAGRMAWLDLDGPRAFEGRVTYPPVDARYRAFVPERSAARLRPSVAALPLQELSRMEARGDLRGIATAYLLYGAPRQALAFMKQLPPSADRDSDLALLALEQARQAPSLDERNAHLEEALALVSGVLERAPRHPQALWNRGLVLRELGLSLLAAQAFGEVARLGEPGWSEEALAAERVLRDATQARGRAWKEAYAAARELTGADGARLPLEQARVHPGILRLGFYDALRAARSREDALRLTPLSRVLDARYGGHVLEDAVARVASRDFSRRGPLALLYARLVREDVPFDGAALETLRRSGESDLYLGALILASSAGQSVDSAALVRLAGASEDPWIRVFADREQALVDQRAGRWWKAEERLLSSVERCQKDGLVYRCLGLERQLTDLYLELHRPAEAFRQAWSGWGRAQEAREWQFEQEFLQELADVARYQHAFASARAYLEESLARMPEDCAQRSYVHRNLSLLAWQTFRPDLARAWLERAVECERPLGMTGAWVLTEMARGHLEPGDEGRLWRALSELRQGGMTPGREALLLVMEGQFTLRRSREEGTLLLWKGLAMGERAPRDPDALKARAFGYSALISEAGRAGAWPEALVLVGQDLRLQPIPASCLLAVSVHHEQTVVLAKGPSGELAGHYDELRTEPLRDAATGLVPSSLLKVLHGCERVDVLARPPVHGLTGLLPDDTAWSYRVGRGETSPPTRGGPGTHLVVTDVASPASLRLPRLGELTPPRLPDPWRVVLRGAAATPSEVLKSMADASEIEVHAHGLYSAATSDASLVVLSPELDGAYALTADLVRQTRLSHAPLVLLATCGAARTAPFPHESYSLPVAFIEAGASAVLASTLEIPDTAGAFFENVRERVRSGAAASGALRDARAQWAREHPEDRAWLPHVLLFE